MTRRGRSLPAADDRWVSLVVVAAFSLGLGVATVAVPLLALGAGYDAAAVGILVAVSATCQFATRLTLPWLFGRFPDRTLIVLASLAMTASFSLLVASTALPAFVAAQLLQGAGRAVFWTSSQTHAVRGDGPPVRRLVDMNTAGYVGTLAGPAIGGTLAALDPAFALAAAAIATGLSALMGILLAPLPRYERHATAGAWYLLRRGGVDVACWASAVGGGWWSMLGSYVPVIGVSAGVGAAGIGWLITASEAAGLVGTVGLRRVSPGQIGRVVRLSSLATAAALAALAVAAFASGPWVIAAFALALVVGGVANGASTTLAPALANQAASAAEQGDALALSGTFRAGALLGAPATVSLLLAVMTVPAAVLVVALGIAAPGFVLGRGGAGARRRPGEVSAG